MGHAADNTLLTRMGFRDPDARSSAHDDACIELATDPAAFIRALRSTAKVKDARCFLEPVVSKGSGNYRTTIGFVDAIVTWLEAVQGEWWRTGDYFERGIQQRQEFERSGPCPESWGRRAMLVEVKSSIGNSGELLRQMNLYREYVVAHDVARNGIDDYVVWSLEPGDLAKFGQLLAGQGYILVAGSSLAEINRFEVL